MVSATFAVVGDRDGADLSKSRRSLHSTCPAKSPIEYRPAAHSTNTSDESTFRACASDSITGFSRYSRPNSKTTLRGLETQRKLGENVFRPVPESRRRDPQEENPARDPAFEKRPDNSTTFDAITYSCAATYFVTRPNLFHSIA